MKIKTQLLEYLIRESIREILDQVSEDETIGAPSPPADGLGTAEQPPIPQDKSQLPPSIPNKGIVLVNPRNKAELKPVPFKYTSDANLERDLFRLGAALGGPNLKISLNATKMVRDGLKNPAAPVFLFVGKYDPESDEIFLMADRDLNTAKENSAHPNELRGASFTSPTNMFDPTTATAKDYASRMAAGGQTQSQSIDELKKAVKQMIKEVFSE